MDASYGKTSCIFPHLICILGSSGFWCKKEKKNLMVRTSKEWKVVIVLGCYKVCPNDLRCTQLEMGEL